MAHKIAWGKELTEEQYFLQSSPYSDDKTKRPSFEPLMLLLDTSEDEEANADECSIIVMKSKAQLEFFLKKENRDATFLICHPVLVPYEFRTSAICANA